MRHLLGQLIQAELTLLLTGISAFSLAFHNGKNLFVYSLRGIAATCRLERPVE
jgi:hypothetical protein